MADDEGWRDRAKCVGIEPNRFFPTTGQIIEQEILDMCDVCPVKFSCRDYARQHNIKHGTWGAESNRQRQKMLKAKRKA